MRKYTILIPHFKTGKITAYCLHQIFKHSGNRVNVVVISNSGNEGLEYFAPYADRITTIIYPSDRMQSHGIAFDYAIEQGFVKTDYFITLESDSAPTTDEWLEYYDRLIEQGYDMAGSRLKLSGGEYIHPAGAMYKLSNWIEAKKYVRQLNEVYDYLPNYLYKEDFPCHIMKRKDFEIDLSQYKIHHSYENNETEKQIQNYLPIAQSVFHQGMGSMQETYNTYGKRNVTTGIQDISQCTQDVIFRMGYEPGQWFGYWHYANKKKVFEIPTQTHWMPNRVNQQQEGTITENGVHHLWGVTAYGTSPDSESVQDIINRKKQQMEILYNLIQNENN